MLVLLHSALALLVLATLTPLSRRQQWWIRDLDFPRPQFLALATILAALYLACLAYSEEARGVLLIGLGLSVACALDHGRRLHPYGPWSRPELGTVSIDAQASTLRVMVANVLMTNRNYKQLLDLVAANNPDLILFLEGDSTWESHLDDGLSDYSHAVRCAHDNLYGMHLYSRLPLVNTEIRYRVQEGIPSIVTDVCWPDSCKLLLHCVHPAPPSPTENERSVERDAELVKVAGEVSEHNGPTLVIGDFNDVPWSRATRLFRKLSGLADLRVGRGLFSTFHADIPVFRWPLDHVFCSEHFCAVNIQRSGAFGSDHFALITTLALQEGGRGDGSLDSEGGDEQEAREIVEANR